MKIGGERNMGTIPLGAWLPDILGLGSGSQPQPAFSLIHLFVIHNLLLFGGNILITGGSNRLTEGDATYFCKSLNTAKLLCKRKGESLGIPKGKSGPALSNLIATNHMWIWSTSNVASAVL